MYQALYRKYRSQTFDEMVGQEVVAKTLKQAVASKKISHAYLFSGPRGTGKTSAAKIFAKAMNCPHQADGEPCNNCDICHDITNGSLEDVIEIDAASNNGVDEIREIRDKSTYAPSRATYKVYIIDEVHMLSTELHKIPATILSRVQRFEFKAIKTKAIKEHLADILKKEGLSFDEEALSLIARRAEGGMRDALSILDQALSLTNDNDVSLEIAEEITGSISLRALDQYVADLLAHETQQALSDLDTIFNNGKSMSRFATDLLNYLRDLLVVQAGGENTHHGEAFDKNLTLSQETIFQMIDVVTKSLPEIKNGTHPKIYAEMMTIRLSENNQKVHSVQDLPDNVAQEIEALKSEIKELKKSLQSLEKGKPFKVTKVQKTSFRYKVDKDKVMTIMRETVAESQKSREYLEALKGSWNEILDSISPQDRALLMGSEPVLANSENAILAFDAAFNAEQAMKRSDLNAMFGNIMSQASGFSPKIMAVPRAEFDAIRSEFAHSLKADKDDSQEETTEATKEFIPEGFDFLADKIVLEEES